MYVKFFFNVIVRDGNCTRGCGYPRILDPTGAGAGSIFHPWVDPHPSANKETLTQCA